MYHTHTKAQHQQPPSRTPFPAPISSIPNDIKNTTAINNRPIILSLSHPHVTLLFFHFTFSPIFISTLSIFLHPSFLLDDFGQYPISTHHSRTYAHLCNYSDIFRTGSISILHHLRVRKLAIPMDFIANTDRQTYIYPPTLISRNI